MDFIRLRMQQPNLGLKVRLVGSFPTYFLAYMDSLRLELHPFGVSCHVLEPGGYRTTFVSAEAMEARVESVWAKLPLEIQEEYGAEFKENCRNYHSPDLFSNVVQLKPLGNGE